MGKITISDFSALVRILELRVLIIIDCSKITVPVKPWLTRARPWTYTKKMKMMIPFVLDWELGRKELFYSYKIPCCLTI